MSISWDESQCNFVVEDDTAEGLLNGNLLVKEINEGITSAIASGVTTDYNKDTGKTDAVVNFDTLPDAGDRTIVEGLIAAHDGEPSTRDPMKYTSIGEETTTETTWQTVFSVELPPIKAGAWQADTSFELKAGTSDFTSGAVARVVAQKLGGSIVEANTFVNNVSLYDTKGTRVPFEAEYIVRL